MIESYYAVASTISEHEQRIRASERERCIDAVHDVDCYDEGAKAAAEAIEALKACRVQMPGEKPEALK
jgi:hypothetical protein